MRKWLLIGLACGLGGVLGPVEVVAAEDRVTSGPAGLSAEELKHSRICLENLSKMDGAKEQFALEYRLPNKSDVTWPNLLDPEGKGKLGEGYLRKKLACPGGGTYSLNKIGENPVCSLGAERKHALPPYGEPTTTTATVAPK